VSELVQATLHAQVCEPVLAVLTCVNFQSHPPLLAVLSYGSATSHGAQQAVVDLNDLLDRLTRYPVSRCGSRVGGYDDAALEAEGKRRGSVGNLDGAVGVGVVVRHCAEP
jgi:hypothetical protein